MDTRQDFASQPLISPERLAADPQAALSVPPSWAYRATFVTPETWPETNPAVQPVVVIWAGRSRVQYEAHSTLAVAIMWEATRLPGVSVAVNTNGARSGYFRFTVDDAGEDLTTVSRFLMDAGPDEQVRKTPGRKWDMRAENLRKARAGKPSRGSRDVLMGHLERIAKEWEASGKMPEHLAAKTYLENLRRLIFLHDLEATGRELSDLLTTVKREA